MFDYILYRIGQFIALSLPLKISYKLAEVISDLRCLFAYQDRQAVTQNLKAIFPQKSTREIAKVRVGMFRNFAKYLVDFFRFQKLDKEYIKKNIRLENMHYFDEALGRGKGVIILTAHLGNWELGGVVTSLLGYPLWVVALPHKDKRVNDFFNFQRESKGVKVIPLGRAVWRSLDLLKENNMVALVGDRDFTEKGIVLDFFGRPAVFPEGAAVFSLKTGAAIVPGFMLRNQDDTFTFRIGRPLEFKPTGNKEIDLRRIITLYKAVFEDYIRKYPDQWYMFRRFYLS